MKKLCLLLWVFLLMGCSKKLEYCGNTYEMEIPLRDSTYAILTLPTECVLTETDSVTYWKFMDGTTVYRMLNSSKGTSKYDADNDVYYSRNSICKELEGNTSVVMSVTKENEKMMRELLGKLEVSSRTVSLGKMQQSSILPAYDSDVPMEFTEANLYMPIGSAKTTFDGSSAQIYVNGLSYCESWVMLRKMEQLKPILLNYLVCDNQEVTKWYQSDDIFYAQTKDRVVAAKKITQNQFVCYIASYNMKDFVLKGVDTLRLDKENI